ncbi:MAG: winged helix-turn-helix domain-containing protein [Acidimicrobiia bacterium]
MLIACWSTADDLIDLLRGVDFEIKTIDDPEEVKPESASEWSAFVLDVRSETGRRLRAATRIAEDTGVPTLVVVDPEQLDLLPEVIADFLVAPISAEELTVRIRRIAETAATAEILSFSDLELNTATYQAQVGGTPMNLTYMEYELLRFFVSNPGRVWSREQLLSRVWGYDYFGGARTVDVHVRRLRAKLGEARAGWITTVRSVGYRFG